MRRLWLCGNCIRIAWNIYSNVKYAFRGTLLTASRSRSVATCTGGILIYLLNEATTFQELPGYDSFVPPQPEPAQIP